MSARQTLQQQTSENTSIGKRHNPPDSCPITRRMTNLISDSAMHHELRRSTKQIHHALDHHPLLAPLLHKNLTKVHYGNALAALHGVQTRAEQGVLAFLGDHPTLFDYQSRLKLWALDADLASLGRSPMDPPTTFPVPDSVPSLIGFLYVFEGSTLGGLFIADRLKALPMAPLPTAHFTVYGQHTAQKWQQFLAFAAQYTSKPDIEQAVTSAISVFDAVSRHLDNCYQHFESNRPAQAS